MGNQILTPAKVPEQSGEKTFQALVIAIFMTTRGRSKTMTWARIGETRKKSTPVERGSSLSRFKIHVS